MSDLVLVPGVRVALTQRQRWSLYLTFGFGVLAFVIGINLRDSALTATELYSNVEAGVEARYPANWLIDTSGNYVFRVRDVARVGFKTTIQVTLLPVNPGVTTERNVLDVLTLSRSEVLANYDVQSISPYLLPDGTVASRMDYSFVAAGANPFLETVPVVVQGVDIIANRRGQAVIISFHADAASFEQQFEVFERFLRDLRF